MSRIFCFVIREMGNILRLKSECNLGKILFLKDWYPINKNNWRLSGEATALVQTRSSDSKKCMGKKTHSGFNYKVPLTSV